MMVNLYVRSFEKIDDVKMEFSVQITFRKCFLSLRQFKAKVQTVSTKQSSILMEFDFYIAVAVVDFNLKIKMRKLNIDSQATVE